MRPASSFLPLRRIGAALTLAAIICTPALAQSAPQQSTWPVQAKPVERIEAAADFTTCSLPAYPEASLRKEQQGTVVLAFLISLDGIVTDARTVKSSGFSLLDIATRKAIARCRFTPTRIDGKREQAWTQLQYIWKLDDPAPQQGPAELERARTGALRGEPEAEFQLGTIMMNRSSPAYDPTDGLLWLRRAAGHGLADAQHALAMVLMRDGQQNQQAAARDWLRRAAAQGYPRSQSRYGVILMQTASRKSIAQGQALIRKAAGQGDQYGLLLRASGKHGPSGNAGLIAWYEQVALGGDKYAQRTLARMYQAGDGVAANPVKAARWRKRADAPAEAR